jgi:LuxR family transcriptional regulator, maltose regulon positive regulatory protein
VVIPDPRGEHGGGHAALGALSGRVSFLVPDLVCDPMTPAGARSSAVLREPPAPRGQRTHRAQLIEWSQAFASDLDAARLLEPIGRPGSVTRTALVNRLRVAGTCPVVTLLAPAGYGKTTLLAQWASRDERPFAWVSVEASDDALLLLRHVAAALNRVQATDASLPEASGPRRRSARSALRRVASAFSSSQRPLVLVLDDVQLLRSQECVDAVAALVDHVPDGSTLVLAGRTVGELPIARLRAAGRLLELGVDELALSRREGELLLRHAGVEAPETHVSELIDRTEGWAAGLYLAAVSFQDSGARADGEGFAGDDRFVADYFRSEYLAHLRPSELRFLTRTSTLDRMSGPLCDAVLDGKGSARKLETLEKSNVFVVPLDRRCGWYRYHRLFRDLLQAELEHREPELGPALNRRAASWCEANGPPEEAISYASAAGDIDTVARLVGTHALPAYHSGRIATIESWLDHFPDDDRGLSRYPAVAVLGAWVHALRGRPAAAERWLRAAEAAKSKRALPDGSTSVTPWLALIRAAMCRSGAEQMVADAEVAVQEMPAESQWRPIALLVRGAALLLLGDDAGADRNMAEAVDAAESVGAMDSQVVALTERSLLAELRGDHADAKAFGLEARALVDACGLDHYPTIAIELAASARAELRAGSWERARADLERANRLRPELTHALPWYSVQTLLELARAHMTLLDLTEAKSLLSEVDGILRRRPDLGTLVAQADELRAESDAAVEARDGRASTLTPAELRLLPLLATHLSFREIGEHLYVSRNTVKTQAISVYRKLGVSSRSEALERAADLGLVEPPTVSLSEFILTG